MAAPAPPAIPLGPPPAPEDGSVAGEEDPGAALDTPDDGSALDPAGVGPPGPPGAPIAPGRAPGAPRHAEPKDAHDPTPDFPA